MEDQEYVEKALIKAIKEKNIKILCKILFNEEPTPLQCELIRIIAFREVPKLSVSAMTRWGKSYCISRGVAIGFLMEKNVKVFFIGPKKEQATILRDYMAEVIMACPKLLSMSDLEATGTDRLRRETSKARMTFREHNNEYRVFSAEGDADRLMGHGIGRGGGWIIKDEATLIKDEASAKITRMSGDAPDKTMIIEAFNPWHRDNVAFKHTIDPDWKYIHIGYPEAIKDGRITPEFIETERKNLTPLNFTVLYESKFPEESADQLIPYWAIDKAQREIPKDLVVEERILGCDIAEMGNDLTVLTYIERSGNLYVVKDIFVYAKQELSETTNKIEKLVYEKRINRVSVDSIGVGAGVFSELRKRKYENNLNYDLKKFKSSEKPINPKTQKNFKNLKAQAYFYLRKQFTDGNIIIPKHIAKEHHTLISELGKMKYEIGKTDGKAKILDPGEKADDPAEKKSPDYADSLKMAVWKKQDKFLVA